MSRPKPKPARRQGNPVDSPWYSTPPEARHRQPIRLSLDPATIEGLSELARPGESRSQVVDRLVSQAIRKK